MFLRITTVSRGVVIDAATSILGSDLLGSTLSLSFSRRSAEARTDSHSELVMGLLGICNFETFECLTMLD